ncbi:hypothetical protein [Altererythrobacter sp. MTPC7]|nr:hypothetical protein PF049_06105 [Erythrobacteraceae bacterium WH01K]
MNRAAWLILLGIGLVLLFVLGLNAGYFAGTQLSNGENIEASEG